MVSDMELISGQDLHVEYIQLNDVVHTCDTRIGMKLRPDFALGG